MSKHEVKNCPRCNGLFECRVGDVLQCQCYGVELTEAASEQMQRAYGDCLCRACLISLGENEAAGKQN